MTRAGLPVLFILLCALPVSADDQPAERPTPLTPEQAADKVLEAIEAEDRVALEALARENVPDPWLVADELCRRSLYEMADAFSKAFPRKAVERLPDYVASRRGKADDPATPERLARVRAAWEARDPARALEAAGAPPAKPLEGAVDVALETERAIALVSVGRAAEAVPAARTAAETADRLGWWSQAAHAYEWWGISAARTSDPATAKSSWNRALELREALGDVLSAGRLLSQLGVIHQSTGDDPGSLSLFERSLAAHEAAGSMAGVAQQLANVGSAYIRLGRLDKAIEYLERALAAKEALGDRPWMAWALKWIAFAHWRRGEWAQALSHDERLLPLLQELGDRPVEAEALNRMGESFLQLGENDKALSAFERALALCEALGNERGAAGARSNMANVLARRGEPAKALPMMEQALAVQEAAGDTANAAVTLFNLGEAHRLLRDYPKAIAALERARIASQAVGNLARVAHLIRRTGDFWLESGESAKGLASYETSQAAYEALGDRANVARVLDAIGKVHKARGEPKEARSAYEQALSISEEIRDPALTVELLVSLGEFHTSHGAFHRALAALKRAQTLAADLEDRRPMAGVLWALGVLYTYTGAYALALDADERALALHEAEGNRAKAAGLMCNLGVVYRQLGELPKALDQFERALAAAEETGNRNFAAVTLSNIADLLLELGEVDKALAAAQRAQDINDTLGVNDDASEFLLCLGNIRQARGEVEEALRLREETLAGAEADGNKRLLVKALIAVAESQAGLGKAAEAIRTLDRAVRTAEGSGATKDLVEALRDLSALRLASGDARLAVSDAHRAVLLLRTLVAGLGEEQGATARGRYTKLFATGLLAAAAAGDATEAVFFLENGRAGSLLESLGARQELRWQSIPEELRDAEAHARAEETRALLAYTKSTEGGDRAAIRARNEELQAARAKTAKVVERIQREAKQAANLWYPVAAPVEEIQDVVEPHEALVLYGLPGDDDMAFALVLTPDEARIVSLGKCADIVAACQAFDPTDTSVDPGATLQTLHDLLIAPLALDEATTRLLVSPSGPLSYLPFAALAPSLDVAYVASGTTHCLLLEGRDKRGTEVLALADPDYSVRFNPTALDLYAPMTPVEGSRGGGRLAPLPGTRAEAQAVANQRLFGKEASEAGLRAALAARKERWLAVHFACHGLVDPERPTLSSLALTPDAANDGFLTALEVLQMQIPADLVVLSACETGKGKIVGGEGIVGLTRAFTYAGAPRVICSLWNVDDEATKALMIKFYELWNPRREAGTLSEGTESKGHEGKGLGAAAALKKAQEYIRSQDKWKHPYYWAAWVLWGLPD